MSRWLCLKIGYPEIWWLSWSHIFRTKNSLFLGVSYHLCRQTRWRFTSSVSLRFPVEGTLDQRDLWVQYGRETTEGAAEGLDEIRCCSGKKHLGTPPEVTWVLVEHRVYRIPQNLIVDHHVPHWKSLFCWVISSDTPGARSIRIWFCGAIVREFGRLRSASKTKRPGRWSISRSNRWGSGWSWRSLEIGKNQCGSLFFDEYGCKTHVKPTNEWYDMIRMQSTWSSMVKVCQSGWFFISSPNYVSLREVKRFSEEKPTSI